ncbi:hypothetical protein AB4Z50_14545 [Paenibacillus sp. 2TAB26]|uniref:hypothetical protein n=1 Tax=Paenibacillus sp. 2TAB26 TaxID=3233005 RepID=UPI003F9BD835
METVKELSESYGLVLANMMEFTRRYPLLIESKADSTLYVVGSNIRPTHTQFVWIGHTGAKGYILIVLTMGRGCDEEASAILLEGEKWEVQSIMRSSNILVSSLYTEAGLKDRRSIIIEICKVVYDQLLQFNTKQVDEPSCDFDIRRTIIEYGLLLDVECIEDAMGFWEEFSENKN